MNSFGELLVQVARGALRFRRTAGKMTTVVVELEVVVRLVLTVPQLKAVVVLGMVNWRVTVADTVSE